MRILVTGASGFVGSLLTPRLCADGHAVRALGRDPARVRAALADTAGRARVGARTSSSADPGEGAAAGGGAPELLRGDALTGAGLERALDGVEVAYYLIHSMESTTGSAARFAERERIAAENFAAAAAAAGVRRIVYLGGLAPLWDAARPRGFPSDRDEGAPDEDRRGASPHLASRLEVEQILLGSVADSLALRASIVIGARSRSFRLLVRLLERMPVLALPAWRRFRTQPIDARDVIEMLAACARAHPPRRTIEIAGPEVLSYGEMLARIAELMLIERPVVPVGVNLTALTARLAAAIAGEDAELVLPLMEGLQGDLLPLCDDAAELLGVRLHSFDAAVERALAEWERSEPLAAR